MIRILHSSPTNQIRTDLKIEEIPAILKQASGILWVDFENSPPAEDEPIMREMFGFHQLAIDDALQESHVPKVDDWDEYLYIVLHSVHLDRQDGIKVSTKELDVFLGEKYLVTHHDETIPALEKVWLATQRDDRHVKNGADHLLYRLVDEVVASYMPVVEEMDETIDETEDQIFVTATPHILERLFQFKRATITLRRIISPQREVLNRLARDDYKVIDAKDRIYFRDVYDHLVRLYDITESMRDLVGGALDTYLSVINNRMNDIMKTLTLITTLFMPISFVAGFFGMNFFQPTAGQLIPWTNYPAFILMMIGIIGTVTGMYLWMRRRGWM